MALFQKIINPYVDNIDVVLSNAAPNVLTSTVFISPTRLILNFSHQTAGVLMAPIGPAHKPIVPPGPKH